MRNGKESQDQYRKVTNENEGKKEESLEEQGKGKNSLRIKGKSRKR